MHFKKILGSPTSTNHSVNSRSPLGNDQRSFAVRGRSSQLRSFCLVIYFTDGLNHGLRLVKLDVFRTIAGEDLFSVGR
jgi:hypothetical protein